MCLQFMPFVVPVFFCHKTDSAQLEKNFVELLYLVVSIAILCSLRKKNSVLLVLYCCYVFHCLLFAD